MKKLIRKILTWAITDNKLNHSHDGMLQTGNSPEPRPAGELDWVHQRLNEQQERFEALTQHLGVYIHPSYKKYQVDEMPKTPVGQNIASGIAKSA